MWRIPDDNSKPVNTAAEHIRSAHCECRLHLPETAVVFFMGRGEDYLIERYHAERMSEPLPRFLNRCPIWRIEDLQLCFLDGGRGAPQAADTVETLAALGVKNIIAVGMCGAYDEKVRVGEVIAPGKAFVEGKRRCRRGYGNIRRFQCGKVSWSKSGCSPDGFRYTSYRFGFSEMAMAYDGRNEI